MTKHTWIAGLVCTGVAIVACNTTPPPPSPAPQPAPNKDISDRCDRDTDCVLDSDRGCCNPCGFAHPDRRPVTQARAAQLDADREKACAEVKCDHHVDCAQPPVEPAMRVVRPRDVPRRDPLR